MGKTDVRLHDDEKSNLEQFLRSAVVRVFSRSRVPAVILAAVVGISLAGCAPGPGFTASPAESPDSTTTQSPETEAADTARTEPAGESERTSNEIVTDLLAIVADLTSHTGGDYTYFDDTPFDPEETAGYPAEECVGRQGRSITIDVAGPPAADIEEVHRQIISSYEARGWEIILQVDAGTGADRELEVSLAEPTGKEFGYGSSSTATTISLQSECSTHPSLEGPST